jgi:hypothetical protein
MIKCAWAQNEGIISSLGADEEKKIELTVFSAQRMFSMDLPNDKS